jgi:MFS family permease
METIAVPKPQTAQVAPIQWKQLWSLAALYASIIIGWIAYENYQPKLLVQFNFTNFTFALILAQAIITVVTPPIAGRMGDRFRFTTGHRLPIISSGISFAAMVFMAVAFTLFTNPGEIFKWVLPVMIILWLVAMSIFTSPALSTMELFTPVDKLPRAMAVLTIVSNLIYALEPVIVDIIDYLGAPLTFIAGGVVTFLSGYALKQTSMGLFQNSGNKEAKPIASIKFDTKKSQYGYIFFMGIVLGLATAVMFNIFPEMLEQKVGNLFQNTDGKFLLVGMLVLSAIVSWPLTNLVNQYGLNNTFLISFLVIGLATVGVVFFSSSMIILPLVVLFVIAFTALSICALPLALDRSNYYQTVFCVGIFFAGTALPEGIWESIKAF